MLFCSVTEGGIIELHFTMWGVLSVKSRKQITVCGYAVINTPAPMKALDKSFLLQISAKTKATKSCHCQTEQSILLTPKSPPLSVSLAPCPSLLTAVIPFIQWTRITTKGLTTSPLYPLMETGQRSLSMR